MSVRVVLISAIEFLTLGDLWTLMARVVDLVSSRRLFSPPHFPSRDLRPMSLLTQRSWKFFDGLCSGTRHYGSPSRLPVSQRWRNIAVDVPGHFLAHFLFQSPQALALESVDLIP